MTLLALALILVPAASGFAAAVTSRLFPEKVVTVAVGCVTGIAVTATALYAFSTFMTLQALHLWGILGVLTAASAVVLWQQRSWWLKTSTDRGALAAAVVTGLIALLLGSKLLFWHEGGLATSLTNAWGDLGWHMSNISAFAAGQTVPPENPIFAGVRLTYPFLTNFYSGLLLRSGASFAAAISLPTILLLWLALLLVFLFTQHLTKSRLAAAIALLLFIGSGTTLGGLRLVDDVATNQQSLIHFLSHLPRDYTGSGSDPDGYHFVNILLAGLLPQRPLLLGFPLALALLLVIVQGFRRHRFRHFVFAGIIAGTIPLAHAHTVIALIPPLIALFIWHAWHARTTIRPARLAARWGAFAITAAVIGLPAVAYYSLGGATSSGAFFKFDPGWTLAPDQSFTWLWLQNTGLLLPLSLLALLLKDTPAPLRAIGLGGLLLWCTANLFVFAPWAWDNYKLLVYWLTFTLPLLGWLCVYAAHSSRRLLLVPVAAVLMLLHSGSGLLDISRILVPDHPVWPDWSAEDVTFAARIQAATSPRAAILTAPYHNTAVALSGRSLYLGYGAHVWSHGLDPAPREQAIAGYYAGTVPVLPETSVEFVVVGPVEQSRYPVIQIRPEWEPVAATPNYQLYRVLEPVREPPSGP